jgi:hypothetical protein
MSRRPATFIQADVARALRAVEQVAPGRMTIEIAPDGTIRIRPFEPGCEAEPAVKDSPLAHSEEIIL